MKLLVSVLALVGSASGLLMGAAPAAVSQRAAVSMACNGGKGGSGGMAPPKDKMRRGRIKALIQAADSAEGVKSILLSSQTEQLLLKMNWKVRNVAKGHIKKRAAQFDVAIPSDFAAFDVLPRNTKKAKLTASIKERSPSNPAAVAALAKLRFS